MHYSNLLPNYQYIYFLIDKKHVNKDHSVDSQQQITLGMYSIITGNYNVHKGMYPFLSVTAVTSLYFHYRYY